MKKILQGNTAIARGAWEAGVSVACAYPGTPSSEILAEIATYREIYTEWSPNQKVALEVAHGASLAGGRAIACMKHVGLNVAADPLMTISYTGVKGGLVIVVADDPGHTARRMSRTVELDPFRQGSHARTQRFPRVQGLYKDRLRHQRAI